MEITEKDKELIRVLQDGLPLVERPYDEIARRAGWDGEAAVIARMREWKEAGVLRRMSAYIRHQRAGYNSNGMVVWDIPEDNLEDIGNRMTESKMISHVYARPRSDKFPYRLYTMVHGHSRDDVIAEAERLANLEKIEKYKILFSKKELKRSTTRLFMEEKR
ncbi:Lrp/AsnC family transcriptional regulator [bacterium]